MRQQLPLWLCFNAHTEPNPYRYSGRPKKLIMFSRCTDLNHTCTGTSQYNSDTAIFLSDLKLSRGVSAILDDLEQITYGDS